MDPSNGKIIDRSASSSILWPVLIALVLLISILPLPGPTLLSLQPWKTELGITLALTVIISLSLFLHRGRLITYEKPSPTSVISLLMCVFCVWSLTSMLWARSAAASLHHSSLWMLYIITFSIAPYLLSVEKRIEFIVRVFSVLCLILAALSIFDYVTMENFAYVDGVIRIRYGRFAELLATLIPVLAAVSIVSGRLRTQVIFGVIAACGWIAAMLSLSKGAFLAGIVGFVISLAGIALFSFKKFGKPVLIAAGVFLVITLVFQFAFTSLVAAPSTTDYISGSADATRSTTAMRVFTWKNTLQMIRSNWLVGVGSDNFGLAFNKARAASAAASPAIVPEIADDYIVERAHNEPLQIFAELGIVGILIPLAAIAFFFITAFRKLRTARGRVSPVFWGAVGGMAAFGFSSMVSSFSFRSAQNGVVFFLVLSVAIASIESGSKTDEEPIVQGRLTGTNAVLVATLILLLGLFAARGSAELLVYRAERTSDLPTAERYFETARALDPNYATADILLAGRELGEGNSEKAALSMRRAIDGGVGLSTTYADLAKYWAMAGDPAKAEATYKEALEIFPGSVFLHVRYAVFLQQAKRDAEAEQQLTAARNIDKRQANGWYALITTTSTKAFLLARQDPDVAPPAELLPANAVFQYVDKIPGM